MSPLVDEEAEDILARALLLLVEALMDGAVIFPWIPSRPWAIFSPPIHSWKLPEPVG